MAERSVRVNLSATVDDYRRGMNAAKKSTEEVGGAGEKAGQQSAEGMSKGSEAAQKFRDAAVGTASTVNTVLVGAVVGFGTAAIAAGVAYNTLEQTSRAALTTILGSAGAAAAQMEALGEFTSTSPFPRQVWIEAQQTLLAFGYAAEDIVPTLSAIQDAVAAAGGSAQDISEITRVLAQVQSTGKVTAETLNQLGVRGIDAASLIGEAMGRTAGQVREDISSGALDAGTFLTTLSEQMQSTFEGAAAGIRETWVGSTDRIKAATRDIGSAIVEPFIAKTGGGAAIDWANGLADALRALEGRIEPLSAILTARAGPAFDRFTELLERMAAYIEAIDVRDFLTGIENMSPLLAGLGAASATAAASTLPFLGQFAERIGVIPAAVAGFLLTVPEFRDLLGDLLAAFAPLLPPLTEFATILSGGLAEMVGAVATAMGPFVELVAMAASSFAALPGPMQTIVLGIGALVALRGPLGELGTNLGRIPRQIDGQVTRLSEWSLGIGGVRGAASGLLRVLGGPWGLAMGGAVAIGGAFAKSQMESRQRTQELTEAVIADSGAIGENTAARITKMVHDEKLVDLSDQLGLSLETVVGALLGDEEAMRRVDRATRDATGAVEGMDGAQRRADETLEQYHARMEAGVGATDGMAGSTSDAAEAAMNLRDRMGVLSGELGVAVDEGQRFAEAQEATEVAMAGAGLAVDGTKESVEELDPVLAALADRMGETGEGAREAAEKMLESWTDAFTSFIDHEGVYETVLARKEEKEREAAQATADATESTKDSWEDYASTVTVSVDEYIGELERQLEAQENWRLNMSILAGMASDEVVDHFMEMGAEGARALDEFVNNATPEQMQALHDNLVAGSQEAGAAWANDFALHGPIWAAIAAAHGEDVAEELRDELRSGKKDWDDVLEEYRDEILSVTEADYVAILEAEAEKALTEAERTRRRLRDVVDDRYRAGIEAEGEPAISEAERTRRRMREELPFHEVNILAKTDGFVRSIKDVLNETPFYVGVSLPRGGIGGLDSAPDAGAGATILPKGSYRVGRGSAAHGYPSVDLPAPTGTPVRAPWTGRVRQYRSSVSYGNRVEVEGPGGMTFRGAHLSRFGAVGNVRAGQVVGYVGSTGNSTGPHLHAEVLRYGMRLEPRGRLKYHTGGLVRGLRGQEVDARLLGKEFVHPPGVVDYYGKQYMEDLRHLRVPKSAIAPAAPLPSSSVRPAPQIDYSQLAAAVASHLPDVNVQVDGVTIARASLNAQGKLARRGLVPA